MHRDIKPENLIFRNEGEETEIVLADFGLSEKVTNFEDLKKFKRNCLKLFIILQI